MAAAGLKPLLTKECCAAFRDSGVSSKHNLTLYPDQAHLVETSRPEKGFRLISMHNVVGVTVMDKDVHVFAYDAKPKPFGEPTELHRQAIHLSCGTAADATELAAALFNRAYGYAMDTPYPPTKHRRWLVFVNPAGGKGHAEKIWMAQRPMYEDAGIQLTVIRTEYRNHAYDYCKNTLDLTAHDAIVVASGDGLLYEVFNGLMHRKDWCKAVLMPIGQVPAGSGNAWVTGHMGAHAASLVGLRMIKGSLEPFDVISLRGHHTKKVAYSIVNDTWTCIADIDRESERYRWMGSFRFQFSGALRIFDMRRYKGRVSFLPVEGYNHKEFSSCPKGGCNTCLPVRSIIEPVSVHSNAETPPRPTDYLLKAKLGAYLRGAESGYGPDGVVPEVYQADSTARSTGSSSTLESSGVNKGKDPADAGAEHVEWPASTIPTQPDPKIEWQHVESNEFLLFSCCPQTHVSWDMITAPYGHLSDGCMDITYAVGDKGPRVSIPEMLGIMDDFETGKHVHNPGMHYAKATSFVLDPGPNQHNRTGVIMIDGEPVQQEPLLGDVHRGLGRNLGGHLPDLTTAGLKGAEPADFVHWHEYAEHRLKILAE